MYKVTCTNCGDIKFYNHRYQFDCARCNMCNSLSFNLRKYEWNYKYKNETSNHI